MFRGSPLKKIRTEEPSSSKRKFLAGNPLWPCPSNYCDGLLKKIPKTKGGFFTPCDQKQSNDPNTCQVSCSFLSERGPNPVKCELCLTPVGGTPSLGVLSGEKTDQGRGEWLNIHAVWKLCAGATTSDGGKYKNATLATGEIVGRPCSCFDPEKNVDDIKEGCTGDIQEGEYVVKDWTDPPLHLHCAKRLWRAKVDEILREKKILKDIGTTAEKESSQPSAPAIDRPSFYCAGQPTFMPGVTLRLIPAPPGTLASSCQQHALLVPVAGLLAVSCALSTVELPSFALGTLCCGSKCLGCGEPFVHFAERAFSLLSRGCE
ncbi:unnamed protein product [Ectocarpus sp. CCAP 1310/34]|nr:unnamed protein product [Ectocarpus sp. CCAP 1310/34]